MRPNADLLFEEFAARHARGEHPDVRDYLDRAGDERDDLAVLIDGYVASVPALEPSAETRAVFAELVPIDASTPPMLAARVRLGMRRSQVVRFLVGSLGVDERQEDKVARYYHELETGLLDPERVEPLVWHNLAKLFGTQIRSLMVRPNDPPPAMVAAYFRRADDVALDMREIHAPAAPAPEPERDDVDRLFTGNA
jgi:hypothetical protein